MKIIGGNNMHVGAINNYSFTSRRHRTSPRDAQGKIVRENPVDSQPLQKSGMSSGAKGLALAMMMIPAAATVVPNLTSCNANAEAYSYCEGCGCDTCGEPQIIHGDTIHWHDTIPVPGSTDTIYIKPNYESPVIDTLNSILNNLGIVPGEDVPVLIKYIDELDTKYNKHLFNGQASSKDIVVYNTKKYGWDDYTGAFNMDEMLADKSMVMLTLAKDGNLYAQKWVAKPGVSNPQAISDYRPTDVAYKLANADAGNVIKWIEHNQDGNFVYDGVIEKGAIPNSVQLTNGYNTTWRWTNIEGERRPVPKSK